jgi:hypothetical protein
MSRLLSSSFAILAALTLVAVPALACERHQNHQASIAEAVPVTPPPAAPEKNSVILISPAAAAMSIGEALGSEPAAMRCRGMRKHQVLTQ